MRRARAVVVFACGLAALAAHRAHAAPAQDDVAGTWRDDYGDAAGLAASAGAAVDPADGMLKLTNASGGFTPPYAAIGEAFTTDIAPLSVAAWGDAALTRLLPAGTAVTIQLVAPDGMPYPDSVIPGNAAGFAGPTVLLAGVLVEQVRGANGKIARLRLKLTLTTSDPNATPALDDLAVSWKPRIGSTAASALAATTWPTSHVDAAATRHTNAAASPVYQVVRWATVHPSDWGGALTRGFGETLHHKSSGRPGGPGEAAPARSP